LTNCGAINIKAPGFSPLVRKWTYI